MEWDKKLIDSYLDCIEKIIFVSELEVICMKEFTDDEIIDIAIQELKKCENLFMMFTHFSFMDGIFPKDAKFQKIKYLLIKSVPFEKHTDHAIKFSAIGLEIANDYKNYFEYKKSLKPKKDYVKWISVTIALISLVWNIYQGITNSNLREENKQLNNDIQQLRFQENIGDKIIETDTVN